MAYNLTQTGAEVQALLDAISDKSEVTWTPSKTSGEALGVLTIDGTSYTIYGGVAASYDSTTKTLTIG